MKKGFTLVELLAVIVILAILLLIAVPKIGDIVRKTRVNAMASTTKVIASKAEEQEVENQVLEVNESLICTELTKLDDNYDTESCVIEKTNGEWRVTLRGANRFEGITCKGTKDNVECNNGIFTILTVELNGGSTEQEFESTYVDGTKIELEDPTKEDYQFNGCSYL